MSKNLFLSLLIIIGGASVSYAQEVTNVVRPTVEKTDKEVINFFKGLTIGGVVQAQWQLAQEKGMDGGPSGAGVFSPNTDNRFMLRRGYLKVGYNSSYFSSLIQINATPEGISLVNAYAQINTASKSASLRVGSIYKPFGYFIMYSSSLRLTPEISRSEQALFTDATAVGARVMLRDTRDKWTRNFHLDLCYFTGSGLKDDHLASHDFIGKLEYVRPIGNFTVGGMFSILMGSLANVKNESYYFENSRAKAKENVGGQRITKGHYSLGATVGLNSTLGNTKVFGEYIFGNQLGFADDNITPSKKIAPTAISAIYDRNFSNFYIYLQHRIAKSNFTFLARYDSMDPNTDIIGDEIGLETNGSTAADIRYSTFGFGVSYNFLKYMSASAYYDIVSNEKSRDLSGYEKNRKDNLFTLRLQCSF